MTEPHSTLDPERLARQGFPEIVYCQSKTAPQIAENLRALADVHGRAFGTRLPEDRASEVTPLCRTPTTTRWPGRSC